MKLKKELQKTVEFPSIETAEISNILDQSRKAIEEELIAQFLECRKLLEQENYSEALSVSEKILSLRPDFAEALYFKGLALSGLNRCEEALSVFDLILKLSPNEPMICAMALYIKGRTLHLLDRIEQAKKSLKDAFLLNEPIMKTLKRPFTEVKSAGLCLALIILDQGVENINAGNMREAEEKAREFIELRREGKENMAQVIDEAVERYKGILDKEEFDLLFEFEDMVKLVAIEDPFERWKVLGRMVSEKWPKDVSAVDAIRKQRE